MTNAAYWLYCQLEPLISEAKMHTLNAINCIADGLAAYRKRTNAIKAQPHVVSARWH